MNREIELWLGLLIGLLAVLVACGPAPVGETPGATAPVEPDDADAGRVEQDVLGTPARQDEEPTATSEATPEETTVPPVEATPESGGTPDDAMTPELEDEIGATPQTPEPTQEAAFSPKLESRLAQLVAIYQSDGLGPASDMAAAMGLQLQGDRVLVIIAVASAEQVNEVIAAVEAVGGAVDGSMGTLVQAWVPISRLNDLASNPAVLAIQSAQSAAPAP